jgi:hypothetical protein
METDIPHKHTEGGSIGNVEIFTITKKNEMGITP